MVIDPNGRRAYPYAWPMPVRAEVQRVAGLMTGHEYITRFIDTAWRASCSTTPQLQ